MKNNDVVECYGWTAMTSECESDNRGLGFVDFYFPVGKLLRKRIQMKGGDGMI